MRILVATDQWFPDRLGGSARVATETSIGLARLGHDVTVVAPATRGHPRSEELGGLKIERVLRRTALTQTLTDVLSTRAQTRRHRGTCFDVVVAHQSTTAVGVLRSSLEAPLALVFHASAVQELDFLRPRLAGWRARSGAVARRPLLHTLERQALQEAATVLVLSEFTRSILERASPSAATRAVLVGGGVDVEAFSPLDGMDAARTRLGIDLGDQLLLTVRRYEPRMGLENLLRALAVLAGPNAPKLAIVGEGIIESPLPRLCAELGLEGRVRLVGRVSDESLGDWYRAADLFVLPTVAYEGFGMVTAEALASGTPVVGTPIGATPELLGPLDPSLVSESTAPRALAASIRGALSAGPELRRRCREYACERFGWSRAIQSWEAALLSTAAPRADRQASPVELAPSASKGSEA